MSQTTPDKIMQVGLGFWNSKTLLSAIELDLFTELARQPGNLDEIRERLNLHERSAADFLDALVAMGFLERDKGTYRNAPDTDWFLDKAKPSFIGGILEMASHRLYPFWSNLTEALRTGQKQNEAKNGGKDFFAAIYADPERLGQFLRGMTGISRAANQKIAEVFGWDDYQSFIDVGTAQGDLAIQIADAHPHLRGRGFDLPAVEPHFNENVKHHGLEDRLAFKPGNFFEDPIPSADVVLMGHILHDWDLGEKRTLISKAFDALPDGGALIAYDAIIDDERRSNAFGLLMSLNMLIETEGGFDYSGADCCGWMKDAGFNETRVQHLVGPDSMIVGIK